MRSEWQSHIDDLLSQYRQMRDRMGSMQRDMAELTATAESADGLVRATVDYRGNLTALKLDPRASRRLDMLNLAELVVSTTQEAGRLVREQLQQLTSEHVPESLSQAVPGLGREFDLSKLLPADPTDLSRLRRDG